MCKIGGWVVFVCGKSEHMSTKGGYEWRYRMRAYCMEKEILTYQQIYLCLMVKLYWLTSSCSCTGTRTAVLVQLYSRTAVHLQATAVDLYQYIQPYVNATCWTHNSDCRSRVYIPVFLGWLQFLEAVRNPSKTETSEISDTTKCN